MPVNDELFKFWTADQTREKQVVDFVVQTRDTIKTARREREKIWLECYNIYRQMHQHQAYQGRANIYLPSGFTSVETIAPRLILGVFGTMPYIKLVPRRNGTEDRARKISHLLQLQADQAEFFWHFLNFIKQMCIYGRGRGKVWWERKHRDVIRKGLVSKMRTNPMTGMEETYQDYGPVNAAEMKFDGPRFRTVDPFRFFEDMEASSISEGFCQIENIIKSESALKEAERNGYYGNMEGIDKFKSSGRDAYSSEEIERMKATGIDLQGVYDFENKYNLSEYWGLFDIEQKGIKEECKITVLGDKKLICIEKNQFWHKDRPYVDCPYIPVDQEMDGIGILEPVKHLIYEQNDTHNQVMDNKTMIMNTMWLIDENAGIRSSDLKMRPGGVIRTRDMKGLQALRPPDFTSAGYQAFGLMERLIKESTGATNPMIGTSSSGDQTATEINSLISEGNVRNKMTLKLIEERAIKRIFKLWYSMDEQLMNRMTFSKVIENGIPQDIQINPEDIYGDYDFEPQGAMTIQQESVKNQQKIAFFNIAAKAAPQVVPFLLVSIWKDMDQRGGEQLERMFQMNPLATTGLVPPGSGGQPLNPASQAEILAQSGNEGRGPSLGF